jgi:hypothetical protein
MKNYFVGSLTVWLLLSIFPGPAAAQEVGVRAGVSGDPDQFYAGVHVEMGPVADRTWFRPNLELGVGHHVTTTAVNFEFTYRFDVQRSRWHPYIGAGPALVITHAHGDTNPGGGFNILLGVQHDGGLFTEFKAGLGDSPSVKFGVGYAFVR